MAVQAPTTYVVNWADFRALAFPVSGAGSNIPVGTGLMRGVTGGTNKGVLIPFTASSNAHCLGLLAGPHIYSQSGDALTASLTQWFPLPAVSGTSSLMNTPIVSNSYPSHPVDLVDTATVVKMDYDLTTAIAVVSNTTTSIVITSFEDDFDSGFIYVNAGTGVGQLLTVKSSSSGTLTMYTTPTTGLDSTSRVSKILPLFEDTVVWTVNSTTAPTTIGGTAAVGTGRAVNIANFISINGLSSRLDPKIYNQTNSLNSVGSLAIYSYLGMVDSAFHPVS